MNVKLLSKKFREGSKMKEPIFDLRVQNDQMRSELLDAVDRVLRHGKLILGPEVEEFEHAVAEFVGTRYAVGVASGSSALYLALRSLEIGPGDEVITTPLTWILTLNAIAACGATPICVDVRDDFNIDPDSIERAVTKSTKAIVPVHFTGQMCEMDRICDIAQKNNLLVVEDAAQSFGAQYRSKKAGSFSKAAAFSMNTMKVLASYGEAGVVTMDDMEVYDKVRMLRYSGTKSDPKKIITNECYYAALNHKIDTIQAAMLLVAMKHLPQKMELKQQITNRYNEGFAHLLKCPRTPEGDIHANFTYAVQTERRDELKEYLESRGIETKIYHIPLASEAPIYAHLKRFETPVAQKVLDSFLSIPAHEKLTDEQVDFVIDTVRCFFK